MAGGPGLQINPLMWLKNTAIGLAAVIGGGAAVDSMTSGIKRDVHGRPILGPDGKPITDKGIASKVIGFASEAGNQLNNRVMNDPEIREKGLIEYLKSLAAVRQKEEGDNLDLLKKQIESGMDIMKEKVSGMLSLDTMMTGFFGQIIKMVAGAFSPDLEAKVDTMIAASKSRIESNYYDKIVDATKASQQFVGPDGKALRKVIASSIPESEMALLKAGGIPFTVQASGASPTSPPAPQARPTNVPFNNGAPRSQVAPQYNLSGTGTVAPAPAVTSPAVAPANQTPVAPVYQLAPFGT